MMQRKSEQLIYSPTHLHDLLNEINKVQTGTQGKLYIILTRDEFTQFEL